MPRRCGKVVVLLSLALIGIFSILGPVALAQQLPGVLFPATYRGTVTDAAGQPMPDGTLVYAIIDSWISEFAEVADGKYRLPVRPPDPTYFGKTVVFYVGDLRANETAIFPNVHDPDANRFPTLNLTIAATITPPEVGDTTLPRIMLAVLGLGIALVLSGTYALRRRPV